MNQKTYSPITPEAYKAFFAQALAYGLTLESGTPNAGVLTGHGVTVSVEYAPATSAAAVAIVKKTGFARLASDEQIFAEIDKFAGEPAEA